MPIAPRVLKAGVLQRPAEIENHMVVIDGAAGLSYFRPDLPGLTVAGIGFPRQSEEPEKDPDNFNRLVTQEEMISAASQEAYRMPKMVEAGFIRTWAGMDGFTPDGRSIMGSAPGVDGLYFATGFSGTGYKTSPAVGMCMAELILDGESTTVDITPFSLDRFEEGATSRFDEYADHAYGGPASDDDSLESLH